MSTQESKYISILKWIFNRHFISGTSGFTFERNEIAEASADLGIEAPRNFGDLIYTYRFRKELPEEICNKAPIGLCWVIRLAGSSSYRFAAVPTPWFEPSENRMVVKVPDATPGIIAKYALNDEQALLAKLRYNRLIDLFLRAPCYSLQNHLRTQVKDVGQIEIDELYLGIDRSGAQFVIPVQAKGGTDKLSIVQIEQDLAFCKARYPQLKCRSIGAQFKGSTIVLMEFVEQDRDIVIASEAHYVLVPKDDITDEDIEMYRNQMSD